MANEKRGKGTPVIILTPTGHYIPSASIRMAATILGQAMRYMSGDDKAFLNWQTLQGNIGLSPDKKSFTFPDNTILKGWSVMLCNEEEAQWATVFHRMKIKSYDETLQAEDKQ